MTKIVKAYPLACPFCDELAFPSVKMKRRILPDRIYMPRECIMGHEFYSVEMIPEDQSAIVDEMREFNNEEKEWKKFVNGELKRLENGHNISGER